VQKWRRKTSGKSNFENRKGERFLARSKRRPMYSVPIKEIQKKINSFIGEGIRESPVCWD